ncbi:hypothetical protein UA08_05618 [Talaromyces atroroseus]|uniref:F-box domain-containing protein n=1 Tax=Talaromyces atroroseus TaxID=1441469 RepID=A0A225ACJ1_TALAT|nr:hypothetical protein UA08_05618 [Talaromyces atroroseus]OKL58822.1 hypothetical protein UA08_05618 [Talaromyces atroroseus]
MPTSFLAFPGEIRWKIYKHLLVLDVPIEPYVCRSLRLRRRLRILRTNKKVYREASKLFYSRNRFAFVNCAPDWISLFLKQIGCTNASYIQDICLPTLHISYDKKRNVALADDEDRALRYIRSYCTDLRTIRTALYSMDYMYHKSREVGGFNAMLEILSARFRGIKPLRKIVGEVHRNNPFFKDMTRVMRHHGWKVKLLAQSQYRGTTFE